MATSASSVEAMSARQSNSECPSADSPRVVQLDGMAPGPERSRVDVSLAPDAVIDAYKRDIDRTLIRENLKLTPDERLRKLQSFMEFVGALRGAPRRQP